MDILLKKHITKKAKVPLAKKRQPDFVLLLSQLLEAGFTIQESLHFLQHLGKPYEQSAAVIEAGLLEGEALYMGMGKLGFHQDLVGQLRLAEVHGDYIQTLKNIANYLLMRNKQQSALLKVLSYPCLLLIFLFGILLGMRSFLLPQLNTLEHAAEGSDLSYLFIDRAPLVMALIFLGSAGVVMLLQVFVKHRSALQKAKIYLHIPVLGKLYMYYVTAYFSREWGRLFQQGLEMKEVIEVMSEEGTAPLMRELAIFFQTGLEKGQPVYQMLGRFGFFEKNMGQIVRQGEAKGKIGEELMIYGDLMWGQMIQRGERWIRWIQPIIFLFVAVLIVSVYCAMLLPIYQQGEWL